MLFVFSLSRCVYTWKATGNIAKIIMRIANGDFLGFSPYVILHTLCNRWDQVKTGTTIKKNPPSNGGEIGQQSILDEEKWNEIK